VGAARSIAFGIGLTLGVVAIYYANRTFDSIWIPFAFISAILLQLRSAVFLKSHGLVGPFAITFGIGVMLGWFSTSGIPPRRMDFLFWPCVALFLPFIGSLMHAFSVTAKVPEAGRRAAWWTWLALFMAGIISVASSSVAGANGMVVWTKSVLHLEPATAETVVHYIRKTIHFSYYGSVGLTAAIATLLGRLNNGDPDPKRINSNDRRSPQPKTGESSRVKSDRKDSETIETGLLDPAETKHKPIIEAWQRGLLFALTVASFDELRQSTQPGRNGSIFDVMLDMSGALVFVTIFAAFATFNSRSTPLKAP
jgi:VanZ family protein